MPLKPRSVPVSLHFDLHLLHNTEMNKKNDRTSAVFYFYHTKFIKIIHKLIENNEFA